MRRAIGINLVIAWRILLMTLLGREMPEFFAEILFSDVELSSLHTYAKKLTPPLFLGEVVEMVARIGGHLGGKKDRSASWASNHVARKHCFTAFVCWILLLVGGGQCGSQLIGNRPPQEADITILFQVFV